MRFVSAVCLSLILLVAAGCNGTSGDNNSPERPQHIAAEDADVAVAKTYVIDKKNSVLNWKGSKIVGKSHNGTIDFKSGEFTTDGQKLTGGTIVVDMTSIKDVDLTDPAQRTKLVGHLKSEDFFNTAEYPEATFVITSVEEKASESTSHLITGDLTIKGITQSVTFPVSIDDYHSQGFNATGSAKVDRSKWDVKFGSKAFFPDLVGDKVISDDIELSFTVKTELKGSIH